ncbi:T9SS type A sorting domain-containing protein [Adhaeribacter pallidiroseus]|uniref:T9SS type A sorting domain-containing protein n=1 Tax=Adhaeribacter pallidiroseus TaxID=2072847 RepID=UPI000E1B8595
MPSLTVTTSDDRTPQSSGYQYHTATAQQVPGTSPSAYTWYYEDANGNPGSVITTGLTLNKLPIAPCSNIKYQLRVTTACGTAIYRGYAYNSSCGSTFAVYPNPADEQLTIESTEESETNAKEEVNIKIYNQLNEVVLSQKGKKQKSTLNTKALKNGLYYLHITDKNGKVSKHQIAISH